VTFIYLKAICSQCQKIFCYWISRCFYPKHLKIEENNKWTSFSVR